MLQLSKSSKKKVIIAVLTGTSLIFSACSGNHPPVAKKPEVYKISFRQLPPPPVYNRVRLVHLPQVEPAGLKSNPGANVLDPQVKLSLKNNTLEQAAIALASIGNYQSYTASSIAKQKISLEAYGTLDQVASQLASKTGAHIVIDHPNRQIRILQQSPEEIGIKPSFVEDSKVERVDQDK